MTEAIVALAIIVVGLLIARERDAKRLFAALEADRLLWKETATEIANRFAYYIPDPETGCWQWQKSKDGHGYGRVRRVPGRTGLAHRLMYERLRQPLPKGLVLDHLCSNTSCVNPDHLEPVTQAENTRRWREQNPERHAMSLKRAQERRHA